MPHTGFISMWIHPLGDGIADGGGTIAFFNSNLDTRTRLFWSNTGGGNSSGTMKLVKGSTGSTSTGYLASWGTWYHVVATWNATTLKAQFYVNGAQMGADITYADTTTAGTSNLIGSFNAGTGLNGSWTGKIQDFLIGQNYPTAADVLALYNSTSANKLYKPFVAGSIDGGYNLWGQDSAAPSSAGAYIDGGTYVSYQLKNQDPWTIEYRTIPNPNNSAMAGVGWYGGNYMGPYMNISNTGGWSAVVGQGATTGTNSNLNLSGTIGFTPTTWLHVVMRYDGAYVDVFVNNVLLTHTFVGLLVDNGGGNQKFKVNGNPWDNNRLGAAKYDNVNVYSYALSNSEIANNYTQSYVYEGITVSESVSIKINVNLSVTDTVTTTESLSVIHYFNFSTFDTITTLEGPLKPAITGATLSTGYASPTVMDGTIMQTSGPGTADWLNIDNAKAEDGLLATSTVVNGVARFTRYAKATGFGFSIPDGSTINGIQVEIKAQSTSTNRSNWTSAILVVNDVVVGSNLATASAVGLSLVYKVFGDSANLWGLSLTAADVNSSTFGFVIGMGGLNSGSQTFSVDHMRMVVTYTSPSVPEQNTPTVMSICNINVNDTITVTDFADDQTAPLEVNVYENIHPRDWIGMFKAPLAYDVPEYTPFGDTYQINPFGDIGSLPNQMNEAGSGY
jgi:hypothetical protein